MSYRKAGLGVAALLAVVLAMGSAGATTYGFDPGGNGGLVGGLETGPGGRTINYFQTFRIITGTNSTVTVVRDCTAVATPAPIATVVRCWLVHGNTIYADKTQGEPGPAATIDQVLTLPLQTYTACIQAYALYSDGTKVQGPPSCAG